jgi:hypothetical protein
MISMQFMDCFDCRKSSSNNATLCPCAPASRPQGSAPDSADGKNGESSCGFFEANRLRNALQNRRFVELELILLKTPIEHCTLNLWHQEEQLKLQVKYRFDSIPVFFCALALNPSFRSEMYSTRFKAITFSAWNPKKLGLFFLDVRELRQESFAIY